MFVTHFIDVSHCNDFSLAKDDGRWPAYNDLFLEIYRLSRCKFAVVSGAYGLFAPMFSTPVNGGLLCFVRCLWHIRCLHFMGLPHAELRSASRPGLPR